MTLPVATRREVHDGVDRYLASTKLLGNALFWTSCYRIRASGPPKAPAGAREVPTTGDVMIDGLSPRLASPWDFGREPPAVLLLTHSHEDHVGAAPALARMGTRIVASAKARAHLAAPAPRLPAYRAVVWGEPLSVPEGNVAVEGRVATEVGHFRAIPAPGHSEDQIAWFHEERGHIFVGDAWFARRRAARRDEDMLAVIQSLRTLSDLRPAVLFPAHGPVMQRGARALEEAADDLEALRSKALALRSNGRSVRSIQRTLLGREPSMRYWSLADFSGRNLLTSLLREN
ncbi:MAG: MBL fold metallo-hydrolase [Thermoplasmatota archaeon]